MMRRRSILSLAAIAAILAAAVPVSIGAQTAPVPLTAFTLGASPNPVGDQFYTTLTAFVLGSNNANGAYVPPDGTVAFYVSSSSTSCSAYVGGGYSAAVGTNGVATVNYYAGSAGTFAMCASYIPGTNDAYTSGTAGVYLLTVNQPALFTVSVPAATIQGQPINFTFGITTPSGQTPPTGTITLEDPNLSDYPIGTTTVTNGVVSPATITATLSSNSYYAIYSGDSNYAPQSVFGTVLVENALSSIVPAAVTAGSGATAVTLNGLGFTGNSVVEIATGATPVILPINSQTPTQIQTTIPAAYLGNPGEVTLEVLTGNTVGGPVQLQVYAPYTDSIAATSPPTTIPYGSTASTAIAATVTRGVPGTDAAVPAGQVNFNLTGTGAQAGYSATLGSATLAQVSTQGTYLNPYTEPMDTFGTGKLISADLNGDGYADVIGLPSFGPGGEAASPFLQVMLSTGFNAFQSESQVFTGCQESDFAVGDINNDGFPDLVVVCNSNGYASGNVTNLLAYYMLGNGDGTFQTPVAFGSNSFIGSPTQVVLGQFNGDGYLDIAILDGVNGYVQVLSPFANPNNSYGPEVGFDVSYGSVVTAGAADFNQDGLSDIAVEEYSYQNGSGSVFVLLSQGNFNGFYVPSESLFSSTAFNLGTMSITDVSGDGYPDIALADPGISYTPNDTGNLLVFENDEYGNLNETFDDPINSPFSVAGVPFPTIGQPASNAAAAPGWNLVVSYIGTNGDLWVSELQRQSATSWTGIASFDTTILPLQTDGGTEPNFIVTGDMNGDGYLDFALNGTTYTGISSCTANDCVLQPWYYSNDSQATLTSSTQLPTPGTYSLTLTYPGDQLYQSSTTSTGSAIQITQGTPTGVLLGPGTVTFGANTTFYATVSGVNNGASPSGIVTFYDGGSSIGTANLTPASGYSATAQFSTTLLAPGAHTITIGYSGDSNYLSVNPIASSPLQVTSTSISLALTSSAASISAGMIVNFQVQASGPVLPAGQTVTLTGLPTAGAITVTLNSAGFASYNYGLFPPGSYNVGATFAGNSSFGSAIASAVPLQVTATPVYVSLSSDNNPVTYPGTFDLNASVTSNGLGVPTGTVGFLNNGTQFTTGTLGTVDGNSGLLSVGTIDTVTGQTVLSIVSGDFNDDGNPDLAVLESGAGSATLLISVGNGDGTFQTPITYSSTTYGFDPTSVALAAADFNADGYTDLVVIASDGAIAVIPAAGDAAGDMAITQSQLIQVSFAPIAVATGDFNGDGHQDFAVISSNTVTAFYGTGSTPTNFPAAGSWSSTSNTSVFTGMTVAQFDQNGHDEIAVSDNAGPDVAVYLWSAEAGTFGSPQTYPVGISASAIASGDLNGDGYPDLAVVSKLDSTAAVLINNGNNDSAPGPGTFGSPSTYGVATQPTAVTIADFNQDGYFDIAVTGTGTGQGGGTTIILGASSAANVTETSLPGAYGQALTAADFNQDGNPDLAVGLTGVTIFLNSDAQVAANAIALPAATYPLTAAFTPASGQFAGYTSSILNQVVNQAASLLTWANPAPITYGTPLSSTQLDAIPSVPGTLTYTPNAGTILSAGPQTLSVSFVPNDTTDYSTTSAQVPLTVNAAATSITWPAPAAITYGTALSALQLNATASVPGTFTYTPAIGAVLNAGAQTLKVNFTPTDSVDYAASSTTVQIQVSQAAPVITWASPAAIPYGTKLSASQLNATASTPGTFTYTPALGTVLTAGTQTLRVSFTPSDTTDYTTATASVPLQVSQAIPAITWANPASISYGTELSATQLNATAIPAGGTFTYTPPAGSTLPVGAQTLHVTYVPADTVNYANATAQVPITVTQTATSVTWATPAAITYGTALSAAQLNATASVPGTFVYTPALGAILAAGTQTLKVAFTPTDTGYTPSTGTVLLQVNQVTPVITWANPAAIPYGTKLGAAQLNATASVPGTLTYTPAAGTLLTAGLQTLKVSFAPTDAVDYAATTSTVQLQVNQATPVITWANPAAITYGTKLGAAQLNATASVPGTLTYTPASGTLLTAGAQTLKVSFSPTDAVDYAATTATVLLQVNQATPTLTWANPAAITYGTKLGAAQLNATASVPGTLTYTPAIGTLLTAGTQTLKVSFSPTDAVDYAATTATVLLQINQATPVITWANPAAITYGTLLSATQLNATANPNGGAFTYTPAIGATLPVGSQTLHVTYIPQDTVDYAIATSQATIVVNQATTAVTWATPAAITYGTPLSPAQLNATAAVPGSFTYTPALGTVLTAGTQTLKVAFTPTDSTDYSPSSGTVQIKVNQATPVITWNAPVAITYGAKLSGSQLNATASAPGAFTYTPALGTLLTAGTQTLNVSFAPTDTVDYVTTTSSVPILVNQATPVITWATPAAIDYGVPLTATQLNASATPAGGVFTYTPPLGAVLPQGTQTLRVNYVPTDTVNYTSASGSVTILVGPPFALTSILPTGANYDAPATTITLTGTGFGANSIVQLNGNPIATTYISSTTLKAVIPASFLAQTLPGNITVSGGGLTTASVTFTVNLPNIDLQFSGPSTEPAGQQPTLDLAFLAGYPEPLQVTLNLTVAPLVPGDPVDPAVQFSTGGSTFTFPLPANSTTVPTIQLQTGTLASTITVTLSLVANGQDVTPTGLQPVVIHVPAAAPVITAVVLDRNGETLTVIITGYSTSRDMTSAEFTFSPASGDTISDPQLSVDLGTSFTGWYGQADSLLYGSAFTYTQNFTLNNAATTIGGVSVTLTNSVGTSKAATAN